MRLKEPPMRMICIVLAATIATGCSEENDEQQPVLYGNWMYASADGIRGTGIEFRNDGTYSQFNLALTSETSADAELETGAFTVNGSSITVTPQQATCPGPSSVLTLQHSFR